MFVNGRPATNRHYLISLEVAEAAAVKAQEEGRPLAEVLRAGFDEYVENVRKPRGPKPDNVPLVALPPEGLQVLAAAWATGDRAAQNATLAAFHQAGWPLRTLAEALVASGAVKNMTRQAVSLRVLAAGEDLSHVQRVVPPSGPRRTLTVTGRRTRVAFKDVGVRVANDVYALAKVRARADGAQMSALCEDILVRYLEGSFRIPE